MEESKMFSGVIQEIVSLDDNNSVIERVVNYALAISKADGVAFFSVNRTGKNLKLEYSHGFSERYFNRIRNASNYSYMANLFRQNTSIIVNDLEKQFRKQNDKKILNILNEKNINGIIICPINNAEYNMGLLNLYFKKKGKINKKNFQIIELLTRFTAISLYNSSLLNESKELVNRLSIINNINRKLAKTINLSKLLKTIYIELSRIVSLDNFYIAIYNQVDDTITFLYETYNGKKIHKFTRKFQNGLTEYIIFTKKPFICNSNLGKELDERGIGLYGTISKSFLGIPLIASNRVIGVLSIQDYEHENAYPKSIVKLITPLIPTISSHVNNALLYDRVNYLASHDELTKAYNFRYFYNYINNLSKPYLKNEKNFSLMLLDLDNFKDVNDNYGHLQGNVVLKEYVDLLKKITRTGKKVFRYGGDEFLIIIGKDKSYTSRVAKNILKNVREYNFNKNIRLTCSIGISEFPTDANEINDLIKITDQNMYRAKANGKDNYFTGE
ncbi:MAG: diguanylate cyclase [Proteobacteria bacterium]|nr:diguanylate cyclase [Pseudomonadota bacterium]